MITKGKMIPAKNELKNKILPHLFFLKIKIGKWIRPKINPNEVIKKKG
jgi:hypothetical protein